MQKADACEFVLQRLLVEVCTGTGDVLKCGMMEFFLERTTCQMQEKSRFSGVKKHRETAKVLEKPIKVDQFELAGFADKWFPLLEVFILYCSSLS